MKAKVLKTAERQNRCGGRDERRINDQNLTSNDTKLLMFMYSEWKGRHFVHFCGYQWWKNSLFCSFRRNHLTLLGCSWGENNFTHSAPPSCSNSAPGGRQPEAQQLSHANAPISGFLGPGRVPHLQIQEVHILVITSVGCTPSHTSAIFIHYHIIHYWWYQMSFVRYNQSQSDLEM